MYRLRSLKGDCETPPGRLVGYARVSTDGQDLDLQLDALRKYGVTDDLIFTDKVLGAKTERPGGDASLTTLKSGDVLLVWRLDRLGLRLAHMGSLIEMLRGRGNGFRSICDGAIDLTTASGELIFGIFVALAHFERKLIVQRAKAGLVAARAGGRCGGRPKFDRNDPRILTAHALHGDRTMAIEDICQSLKISRATSYRCIKCCGGYGGGKVGWPLQTGCIGSANDSRKRYWW